MVARLLTLTLVCVGRDESLIDQMRHYLIAAKLFSDDLQHEKIVYSNVYEFDMCTVAPYCSGPKRPQDKVSLCSMRSDFQQCLVAPNGFKVRCRMALVCPSIMLSFDQGYNLPSHDLDCAVPTSSNEMLKHGSITLAAITNSTNGISHATSLLTAGRHRSRRTGKAANPGLTRSCRSQSSNVRPSHTEIHSGIHVTR